jgi:hypothetical protein
MSCSHVPQKTFLQLTAHHRDSSGGEDFSSRLLSNPFRRRILSQIAVRNPPTFVLDDKEAIQHPNVTLGTVKKSMVATPHGF